MVGRTRSTGSGRDETSVKVTDEEISKDCVAPAVEQSFPRHWKLHTRLREQFKTDLQAVKEVSDTTQS